MPGGNRGLIDEDIAESLNGDDHKEVADALIVAIKSGKYEVQATPRAIGRAYELCEHKASLHKVYCAASEYGRLNFSRYED